MKDTWCVLPWVHLCVRTDNILKPCCRFIPESAADNVSFDMISSDGIDAMNNDTFISLRKNMLNGKRTTGCQKCYTQETKNSGTFASMRQHYNNVWNDVRRDNCTEFFSQVRYIEMSVDNICNLQCKMCDSKFSSKLINRDKLLGNPVYKKLEPNFQKLDLVDLSKLQKVKILGGEPFITPNFEKFIDYLIDRSDSQNITIDIVTNATAVPHQELIKKLNSFKFININVSLDSYDRANDYQRYGSNYKQTYDNSLKYREIFHNAEFSYHCTITTLTANKLSKTLNFFESNNDHSSVDFVRHPEHLSLLYVPDILAKWILEQNKNNANAYSLVNTFLKQSKYNETFWNNFVETNHKLDKYYNTSLKDYNIDLYNFLVEHKLI